MVYHLFPMNLFRTGGGEWRLGPQQMVGEEQHQFRTFWQYSCMRAGRFIYQLLSFLVNTASFRQTQAVLAIGRLVE